MLATETVALQSLHSPPMKQRILIISDDRSTEPLRRALAERGFEVMLTEDANDGYRQIQDVRFDLVLVNLESAITGAGLIKRIRSHSSLNQLRVMTVAEWGTGQATMALAQGVDAFEPKPVETGHLVETIERLLQPVAMPV
jgi:DNA-binding response OmpR family regulator